MMRRNGKCPKKSIPEYLVKLNIFGVFETDLQITFINSFKNDFYLIKNRSFLNGYETYRTSVLTSNGSLKVYRELLDFFVIISGFYKRRLNIIAPKKKIVTESNHDLEPDGPFTWLIKKQEQFQASLVGF